MALLSTPSRSPSHVGLNPVQARTPAMDWVGSVRTSERRHILHPNTRSHTR